MTNNMPINLAIDEIKTFLEKHFLKKREVENSIVLNLLILISEA